MLSQNENQIKQHIESSLTGTDKEEAFLYHISVERKLEAVNLWFENVQTILPDVFPFTRTYSTTAEREEREERVNVLPDMESTIINISAYIDAFFMGAKSALDTFAHEIRTLYGLAGHTGDLYFSDIHGLLRSHHPDTELFSYLDSLNINHSSWYEDLNLYRRASTHERILSIRPTLGLDFLTSEWRDPILKLPLDTTQRPLQYDGKNFIDTGLEIKEGLRNLVIEGYDKILNDITNNKTKISI